MAAETVQRPWEGRRPAVRARHTAGEGEAPSASLERVEPATRPYVRGPGSRGAPCIASVPVPLRPSDARPTSRSGHEKGLGAAEQPPDRSAAPRRRRLASTPPSRSLAAVPRTLLCRNTRVPGTCGETHKALAAVNGQ